MVFKKKEEKKEEKKNSLEMKDNYALMKGDITVDDLERMFVGGWGLVSICKPYGEVWHAWFYKMTNSPGVAAEVGEISKVVSIAGKEFSVSARNQEELDQKISDLVNQNIMIK